jgi:hypothetical protein
MAAHGSPRRLISKKSSHKAIQAFPCVKKHNKHKKLTFQTTVKNQQSSEQFFDDGAIFTSTTVKRVLLTI